MWPRGVPYGSEWHYKNFLPIVWPRGGSPPQLFMLIPNMKSDVSKVLMKIFSYTLAQEYSVPHYLRHLNALRSPIHQPVTAFKRLLQESLMATKEPDIFLENTPTSNNALQQDNRHHGDPTLQQNKTHRRDLTPSSKFSMFRDPMTFRDWECFHSGRSFSPTHYCPARGQSFQACGKRGNFESVCRSTKQANTD